MTATRVYGPVPLQSALIAGSNVTISGGTSDGAGGYLLTSPLTINATGGGGTYYAGTGLTLTSTTFAVAFGATSSTVCVGNDSRLSDARTPTAHAASHHTGGTDALTAANVGADPAGAAAAVTTTSIGAVPTSRTVNSYALTSNISLTAADVGAIATSVLTTRGDLLTRSATVPARLAIGTVNQVLMSNGTDPGWYTVSGALSVLGSTRGQILRYGGSSAWEALAANTANTFLGGDGTDVGVRTAAQVRSSLGLPGFTPALAQLRVNAAGTAFEAFMAFVVDEPWNRPDPVTAGAGAQFFNKRDGTLQLSTGIAAAAGVASGWQQVLPTRYGPERAGLKMAPASTPAQYVNAGPVDLSGFTANNLTIAILFYYDGTLSGTAYAHIGGVGDQASSVRGTELYLHGNAGNIDLLAFTNSTATTVKASLNPSTGLHALVIAPITGTKWRYTLDGVAVGADVAITGGAYTVPSTADYVSFGSHAGATNSFTGQIFDMLVWNSLLSSADMATLTTLPGTPTYQLAETASTGAAAIRIQASRYDPSQPTALPCRGAGGACVVNGSVAKVTTW